MITFNKGCVNENLLLFRTHEKCLEYFFLKGRPSWMANQYFMLKYVLIYLLLNYYPLVSSTIKNKRNEFTSDLTLNAFIM